MTGAGCSIFGEEKQADVVIFGHIHVPVCVEEDGILLVNPGSPSRPRNGVPSFGILTLEKAKNRSSKSSK